MIGLQTASVLLNNFHTTLFPVSTIPGLHQAECLQYNNVYTGLEALCAPAQALTQRTEKVANKAKRFLVKLGEVMYVAQRMNADGNCIISRDA